jgi:poly [ADP-ribose] polymerase 2/3/4
VKANPKANPPIDSRFVDDEFVIYNAQQQKLKYLVEFNLNTDVPPPIDHIEPPHELDQEAELIESIQTALSKLEIKNSMISEKVTAKTESFLSEKSVEKEVFNAGLYSSTGAKVPLKSTHIRARILDVIGQVYLFQQYTNDSASAIEAKYVFPLDEMSAVCGFEAFINGKHIIGHVEEKKKARKEYKKAIEQGHGAYLMEQELPDCWTVSVGNLPPKCTVFIKIIYVTELQLEGEEVIFQFPSSLGGTAAEKAKHQQFQNTLETQHVDRSALSSIPQTLQIGIEMPYDIDRVYSTSHPEEYLLVKYTDTMATIELDSSKYQSLGGKDFALRIALANAYHPRMWIEEQTDHHDNRSNAIGL